MSTEIKIKNLLLSFIMLALWMPFLEGQIELKDDRTNTFKITVKKYEVIETEIHTMDGQLIYANTDITFVAEETGVINLENLSKEPGLNAKIPKNQNFLTNNSKSNSILFSEKTNI